MEANFGLKDIITCGVIAFSLGALTNWGISKYRKTNGLTVDRFIMVLSLIFLAASVFCAVFGVITELASAGMTFFSSVIFSWLLTRESSKADLKAQEQELALKSYRHINYLETAAFTAGKTIDQYISEQDASLSKDVKLVLSRAMDQIGYIQGGINTCKMDWVDLLSESDKAKCANKDDPTEYGTVVDANTSFNQEDV